MANPDEGELEFTTKGQTLILSFNNRALRTIEAALRKPVGVLMKEMQTGASITDLTKIFYLGLKKHQPLITEDEAADLVRPGQLTALIGQGLELAFGTTGDSTADPPLRPSPSGLTGSETGESG